MVVSVLRVFLENDYIQRMILKWIRCFFPGITAPLVVTESGEKLGKTSGNAVWLDQNKTTQDEMVVYLNSLSREDLLSLTLKIAPHSKESVKVSDWAVG